MSGRLTGVASRMSSVMKVAALVGFGAEVGEELGEGISSWPQACRRGEETAGVVALFSLVVEMLIPFTGGLQLGRLARFNNFRGTKERVGLRRWRSFVDLDDHGLSRSWTLLLFLRGRKHLFILNFFNGHGRCPVEGGRRSVLKRGERQLLWRRAGRLGGRVYRAGLGGPAGGGRQVGRWS